MSAYVSQYLLFLSIEDYGMQSLKVWISAFFCSIHTTVLLINPLEGPHKELKKTMPVLVQG